MIRVLQLELARTLRTPAIWIIAAALQCVYAWYCLAALEAYLEIQPRLGLNSNSPGLSTWLLARYCLPAIFASMFAVPVLCMQKIAGDRQSGTLSCLLVAPVSSLSIAAGKLCAVAVVLAGFTLLSLINVLTLLSIAPLDVTALAYAHACQFAFLVACAGIGMVCTAWCRSPQVAAFSSAAVLMLLWLVGQGQASSGFSIVKSLSLGEHIGRALAGVLHTGDLLYFVAVVAVSIAVTTRAIENDRVFGDRS
ncbi:MAG: ABC transporter permease [Pseudomonadota bacterium]